MTHRRLALAALLLVTAEVCAQQAPIVVEGTLETSLAQPMVLVRLAEGRRVLTGRSTDLERLLGDEDYSNKRASDDLRFCKSQLAKEMAAAGIRWP